MSMYKTAQCQGKAQQCLEWQQYTFVKILLDKTFIRISNVPAPVNANVFPFARCRYVCKESRFSLMTN